MAARRACERSVPDATTLGFLAAALVAAAIGLWLGGTTVVTQSATDTALLSLQILPQLACGLMIGAFVGVLLPRDLLIRWVGEESGLAGLAIASIGGAFMPGGPFAAFPVIHALYRAGAGAGAVVAFLVAWSCVGVNRLFIWEIPFLGTQFGLLRLVSTLPLPLLAGLAANALVRAFPSLDTPGKDGG